MSSAIYWLIFVIAAIVFIAISDAFPIWLQNFLAWLFNGALVVSIFFVIVFFVLSNMKVPS